MRSHASACDKSPLSTDQVLQMAVSATGAAGPGPPDERRARQAVLRRGQCHAAMPLFDFESHFVPTDAGLVTIGSSRRLELTDGEQVLFVESSSSSMLEAAGSRPAGHLAQVRAAERAHFACARSRRTSFDRPSRLLRSALPHVSSPYLRYLRKIRHHLYTPFSHHLISEPFIHTPNCSRKLEPQNRVPA